jgi:hypothetical protein
MVASKRWQSVDVRCLAHTAAPGTMWKSRSSVYEGATLARRFSRSTSVAS